MATRRRRPVVRHRWAGGVVGGLLGFACVAAMPTATVELPKPPPRRAVEPVSPVDAVPVPMMSVGAAAPALPTPPAPVRPPPFTPLVASRVVLGRDRAAGVLRGHVVGPEGEPLAGVLVLAKPEEGGVHGVRTDAEGRYEVAVPQGRTRVAAHRWDDLVEVQSEEELVRMEEGGEQYMPITMQAAPAADAGIVAVEHPEGFEVRWAIPGQAAAEEGLAAGDRILAVDGVPATELTAEDLERRLVGTAGSRVEVTVEHEGQRMVVDLARRPLEVGALLAYEPVGRASSDSFDHSASRR